MEHISIEINKDFGRYKHNFFLGYTLSECFFFFLGGLCCVLIILPLGLLLHIDLFITGWCGVIPASAIYNGRGWNHTTPSGNEQNNMQQ